MKTKLQSNKQLISVIIPCYNSSSTIEAAVDSVMKQTHNQFEIIVCDDGSTDGTLKILEMLKYKNDTLTVLSNVENEGPSYSRNRCIDKSSGDWIAVLDADDTFEPSRLEQMLAYAVKTKSDIVIDNLKSYSGCKASRYAWNFSDNTVVTKQMLTKTALPFSTTTSLGYSKPFMNRNFICKSNIRYAEDISLAEDLDLLFQILNSGGKIRYTSSPLYNYSITENSLSRKSDHSWVTKLLKHNNRLIEKFENDSIRSLLDKRSKQLRLIEIFYDFKIKLKKGDFWALIFDVNIFKAVYCYIRLSIARKCRR